MGQGVSAAPSPRVAPARRCCGRRGAGAKKRCNDHRRLRSAPPPPSSRAATASTPGTPPPSPSSTVGGRVTHALGDARAGHVHALGDQAAAGAAALPDRRVRRARRSTTRSWRWPPRRTTAAICSATSRRACSRRPAPRAEQLQLRRALADRNARGGSASVRRRGSRSAAPQLLGQARRLPRGRADARRPARALPRSRFGRCSARSGARSPTRASSTRRACVAATDGCSAPNFACRSSALARAFKNLATRGPAGAPLDAALARVRAAMQAHPQLVSGPTRFDYELARAFARPRRVQGRRGGAAGDRVLRPAARHRGEGPRRRRSRAARRSCMAVLAELGLLDDADAGRPRPPRAAGGHELPRASRRARSSCRVALADCP